MASKKTFKETMTAAAPAMSFISQESIDRAEGVVHSDTPAETKQESVQPSLHDKLKAKAQSEGTSVNDLIHTILVEAMREE